MFTTLIYILNYMLTACQRDSGLHRGFSRWQLALPIREFGRIGRALQGKDLLRIRGIRAMRSLVAE